MIVYDTEIFSAPNSNKFKEFAGIKQVLYVTYQLNRVEIIGLLILSIFNSRHNFGKIKFKKLFFSRFFNSLKLIFRHAQVWIFNVSVCFGFFYYVRVFSGTKIEASKNGFYKKLKTIICFIHLKLYLIAKLLRCQEKTSAVVRGQFCVRRSHLYVARSVLHRLW
jgi:hypothetical protein